MFLTLMPEDKKINDIVFTFQIQFKCVNIEREFFPFGYMNKAP